MRTHTHTHTRKSVLDIVEICYRYLNRIVAKCVQILSDSKTQQVMGPEGALNVTKIRRVLTNRIHFELHCSNPFAVNFKGMYMMT